MIGCANNLENSSTTKIGQQIPWRYSVSAIWAFNSIENKHTLYQAKDIEVNTEAQHIVFVT